MKPALEPQRMKQLLAVSDWSVEALALQGGAAAIGMAYLSMNQSLRLMIAAIGFDLMTGFACAMFVDKCGPFNLAKMGKGITSKGLSFAIVYYLSTQPALNIAIAGYDMHVASAAALWYCVYDWLSVVKHMDDMGFPVPPILRSALSQAREAVDKIGDSKVDQTWDKAAMNQLTGKPKEQQ